MVFYVFGAVAEVGVAVFVRGGVDGVFFLGESGGVAGHSLVQTCWEAGFVRGWGEHAGAGLLFVHDGRDGVFPGCFCVHQRFFLSETVDRDRVVVLDGGDDARDELEEEEEKKRKKCLP